MRRVPSGEDQMRLVRNGRRGRLIAAPMPLEVCPGRQIWERYRNREYVVFVDESFYRFFGFDAEDGNFCHAAVGIPTDNYAQLQTILAPLIRLYRQRVHAATGSVPREVKFTVLRNLPLSFRLRFARELVRGLIENGGFVAGFYSSTRGIVMERVRTSLLDEADEVPRDYVDLYNNARAELLGQFEGIGQSGLITQLLLTPFSSFSSLLNSFGCHFRVRYDPRQEDEDAAVRDHLAEYMRCLVRVPELFGDDTGYLGMETDIRSHDDLGLQLADVVAGEVREFFRRNPEPLIENSTMKLITPESDEPLQKFIEIDHTLFKNGALSPMSPELLRKLARRNSANLISYYYPVLSAGMLTCVTDTGQYRDLEISTGFISDLTD